MNYITPSIIKHIDFGTCHQMNPCYHTADITFIDGNSIDTGFNRKEIKKLMIGLRDKVQADDDQILHMFKLSHPECIERILNQEITPEVLDEVNSILANIGLKKGDKTKIVNDCWIFKNTVSHIQSYLDRGLNMDQRGKIQEFLEEDYNISKDMFNAAWDSIVQKS